MQNCIRWEWSDCCTATARSKHSLLIHCCVNTITWCTCILGALLLLLLISLIVIFKRSWGGPLEMKMGGPGQVSADIKVAFSCSQASALAAPNEAIPKMASLPFRIWNPIFVRLPLYVSSEGWTIILENWNRELKIINYFAKFALQMLFVTYVHHQSFHLQNYGFTLNWTEQYCLLCCNFATLGTYRLKFWSCHFPSSSN